MPSRRQEKVEERLRQIIARFLNETANSKSVITVTHCETTPNLEKVTAYLTIWPEENETEALSFAKRQRSAVRALIAEQLPMKTVPRIEIEIDASEKNRQKIEGLLNKI